jgi:hypothetical protein
MEEGKGRGRSGNTEARRQGKRDGKKRKHLDTEAGKERMAKASGR